MTSNAKTAFESYENVRGRLPSATFPASFSRVDNLGDVAAHYDVFLLDAFGVLNIGASVVAGAPERVAALQAAGKRVMVVTNGASQPAEVTLEKFRKMGFEFTLNDIVGSRDALAIELAKRRGVWGVMGPDRARLDLLPIPTIPLLDDPAIYDKVDGIILLGSSEWTASRQEMLIQSLQNKVRPVLCGNPDIVAPREDGLSMQAGSFAHDLADKTGIDVAFFGKPFGNIFELAMTRGPKGRMLMVGDTLQTDILGGAAFGIDTMLILNHGVMQGLNIAEYIAKSGIVPNWIAPTT